MTKLTYIETMDTITVTMHSYDMGLTDPMNYKNHYERQDNNLITTQKSISVSYTDSDTDDDIQDLDTFTKMIN